MKTQRASSGEIEAFTFRIAEVHQRLTETNNRLRSVTDRLFGPENQAGQCGEAYPEPQGLLQNMQAALSLFEDEVARTKEVADRLGRL